MKTIPTKRESRTALEFFGVASDKLTPEECKYLGKLPQRRQQHEAGEQAALFQWARLAEKQYPALALMFHIPNGGGRKGGAVEGKHLKAQGVKAGVPDIFLPAPSGIYHGLFIELKAQGGRLQNTQRTWIDELAAQGYKAIVCFGFIEAKTEIEKYLNIVR